MGISVFCMLLWSSTNASLDTFYLCFPLAPTGSRAQFFYRLHLLGKVFSLTTVTRCCSYSITEFQLCFKAPYDDSCIALVLEFRVDFYFCSLPAPYFYSCVLIRVALSDSHFEIILIVLLLHLATAPQFIQSEKSPFRSSPFEGHSPFKPDVF